MNLQDIKANNSSSFTQDHELLGNIRSNVQTDSYSNTSGLLRILLFIYLFIIASSYLALHCECSHHSSPIRQVVSLPTSLGRAHLNSYCSTPFDCLGDKK